MESDKPCKSSSTSNFPSKKEERPKKFKGEDHKKTLYKLYYSGTGRDHWRTSDVVPHSEVALAKPPTRSSHWFLARLVLSGLQKVTKE